MDYFILDGSLMVSPATMNAPLMFALPLCAVVTSTTGPGSGKR